MIARADQVADGEPRTVLESLDRLDDECRTTLLRAAQGDRTARDRAIATLPFWWESMMQAVRDNVNFRVATWRRDHPDTTTHQANIRKLDMLLPHIRWPNGGIQKLIPARTLPSPSTPR